MIKSQEAAEMAKAFMKALPQTFSTLNQEMRIVLEQTCQEWLHKMDVVTREEFDIQTKVLQKTRAKLEKMEQQLDAITNRASVTTAD